MARKRTFIRNRYCYTKTHEDPAIVPGRIRNGRWRVPEIDMDEYNLHVVTKRDVGRLDSVAYEWYSAVELWPIIAYYNSIRNPLEDMYVGQILKIPVRDALAEVTGPIVSQ